MAVICVTYDLHNPGQRWKDIDEVMKGLGAGRVLQSAWLVANRTPAEVWTAIKVHIDENDDVLLMRITSATQWYGLSKEWTEWLQKNL